MQTIKWIYDTIYLISITAGLAVLLTWVAEENERKSR